LDDFEVKNDTSSSIEETVVGAVEFDLDENLARLLSPVVIVV